MEKGGETEGGGAELPLPPTAFPISPDAMTARGYDMPGPRQAEVSQSAGGPLPPPLLPRSSGRGRIASSAQSVILRFPFHAQTGFFCIRAEHGGLLLSLFGCLSGFYSYLFGLGGTPSISLLARPPSETSK